MSTQLIVVDPDDLLQVLGHLCLVAAALGFVGAMAFSMVVEIGRGVAKQVRKTEWWHRRKAEEAYWLGTNVRFLDRLPPSKREKVQQRLMREAFDHGYTADAIAAQKREKRELKAAGS